MTQQEETDLRQWATASRAGGLYQARLVLVLLDELDTLRGQIQIMAAQSILAPDQATPGVTP